MLCDVEAEALSRATESLKATNADVHSVKADVSLKAELKAAADATVARFGKVHADGEGAAGEMTVTGEACGTPAQATTLEAIK
jgi:NAD(P)-dependent dehydrogenase (short-subunit alcohol dehydrogenase family)